ncbi:glycosyltransferase family 4 protein [Arsenicibacter rosenii]|uniref:Glycosyl transferase family 1 n=1 Tax=Arsenicibacter rosenii TaxID=1750698 RepID=A0A1S2VPT6_9BACT|nr:glycosyltransferase family 4 protein [Arsenicibacter rosenii]OIN60781.1 glycosyl transferase family 1 [Arsenicibacter rosenii]
MKTILLIGHDANRAGAQLVLLQLMRLLKQEGIQMHLLLGTGGPLLEEYQQVASVTVWPANSDQHVVNPLVDKVLGKIGLWDSMFRQQQQRQQAHLRQSLHLDKTDLILVNTVSSSRWFYALGLGDVLPGRAKKIPVITFAHELAMSVSMYTKPGELTYLLDHTDHLLAVSKATASYYVDRLHVDPKRITLFTLIDTPSLQQQVEQARHQPTPLPALGIPADAIVVGGCGLAEWRKGNDLFVTLARLVSRRPVKRPVHFVWVGMKPGGYRDDLWLDVQKAGLTDIVHFVEPTPEVLRYMAGFHMLALTSREDPYPLVVLEAGLSQVPVLCFEGAGGSPELVERDGGVVVPYLDIEAMADSVAWLADDDKTRTEFGKQLRVKVLQRHPANQSVAVLLHLIGELA